MTYNAIPIVSQKDTIALTPNEYPKKTASGSAYY
jgi:hypothetical protein